MYQRDHASRTEGRVPQPDVVPLIIASMTLRDFFVGRAAVFAFVLVVALGFFLVKTYVWPPAPAIAPETKSEEAAASREPSAFAWRFEKADSMNPDGNPETDVLLDIAYTDSTIESVLIDTTPGNCNELPDPEEQRVEGTGVVQCYAAGLGYRYKITKGESSYLIERKEFEEGSPEYVPVVQEYKIVSEIPFSAL